MPQSPREKVILITGATSGIGLAAARVLSEQGNRVIVGGRDAAKLRRVQEQLQARSGDTDVETAVGDLSIQDSVRAMVDDVLTRFEKIDILINNAGVDVGTRTETPDGLELTFAVNVVAPFLLTSLLLDRLKATAGARVLNLVSGAHRGGRIDFDDLQSRKKFSQRAYNNSKLALVMLTEEWARRVDPALVTVNGVDPGFVRGTNIGRTLPFAYQVIGTVMLPFMATPDKAGRGLAWAAIDPSLERITGAYLKDRKVVPAKRPRDRDAALRLWDTVAELASVDSSPTSP